MNSESERNQMRIFWRLFDFLLQEHHILNTRIEEYQRSQNEIRETLLSLISTLPQYSRSTHSRYPISSIPLRTTFSIPARATTESTDNGLNATFNILEVINDLTESVNVRPTTEQINNAITICQFSDIINPLNTSCPIRSEEFNPTDEVVRINQCNHIFFKPELLRWLQTNVRCPICRYDIRGTNSRQSTTPQVDLSTLFPQFSF